MDALANLASDPRYTPYASYIPPFPSLAYMCKYTGSYRHVCVFAVADAGPPHTFCDHVTCICSFRIRVWAEPLESPEARLLYVSFCQAFVFFSCNTRRHLARVTQGGIWLSLQLFFALALHAGNKSLFSGSLTGTRCSGTWSHSRCPHAHLPRA